MARQECAPGRAAGREAAQQEQCPFLQRCAAAHGYPLLGYCQAYLDSRLRAVTIAEFRDHCTGPGYRQCRTYQVRIAQEAADAA